MVITRKIEILVNEKDKNLREAHYKKLYENRRIAVEVANMGVSHLFALDNTMPYLSQADKETITYLGCKGNKSTKMNAPYVVASEVFKGKADMGMVSCVLQNVQKMYQDDRKKGMWNRSLRSYKDTMPIPYKADRFLNLSFVETPREDGKVYEDCIFTLMGIPFKMRFGKDRSGNRIIVQRIIAQQIYEKSEGKEGASTGYQLCTSSIQLVMKEGKEEKKNQKIFLLLCVNIPQKEVVLDGKKTLYAVLGIMNPIVCTTERSVIDAYIEKVKVSGGNEPILPQEVIKKLYSIGTREEFNYRRRQIQEAVKRCQTYNKFNVGGKGRKRKCKAIEHWHDVEKNYIATKLHNYSKELVKIATDQKCGNIKLLNQSKREFIAKQANAHGNPFVLRNWSYYGLKDKVKYKSQMFGIKFFSEKEELTAEYEALESVMLGDK